MSDKQMSEAKFTEGEWKVEGTSMSMGASYRGNFFVTSNCFDGDIDNASLANAHLIAAAPEMYELLKSINDHIYKGKIDTVMGADGEPKLSDKLFKINELLAKARGES